MSSNKPKKKINETLKKATSEVQRVRAKSSQKKSSSSALLVEPTGNTKSVGSPPTGEKKEKKPRFQLYNWFFTLPITSSQISQIWELLNEISKKFVFQIEKGEDTGYLHYQGVFSLKMKEYFNAVKNMLPNEAHIEPAKDLWKAIGYCSKENTRIDGPWTEKKKPIKILSSLRPWQTKTEEMLLLEPDDRSIIWVFDAGGTGKTQFCKYMAVKHGCSIFNNATSKDIAFALPEDPSIVMFNFPKDTDVNMINYKAIEAVKDGLIFSAKYESRMKIFNSPHVICFSNQLPNVERLTADKWIIYTTNNDFDLVKYKFNKYNSSDSES